MKALTAAFLLVLLGTLADAQTASAPNGEQSGYLDAQRARITAERSKLETGFLTEDAACYKKFAVNRCLSQINVRRREAMADLRRQEILLNDEERKIKGQDQIRRTQEKFSEDQQLQTAELRAKAAEDYQERLKREKDKQQERTITESNEKAMRKANDEKRLAHEKKTQARTDKQAGAAEEAKKFNERLKEAQARQAQHKVDQQKQVKPSAKPLPLPEQ